MKNDFLIFSILCKLFIFTKSSSIQVLTCKCGFVSYTDYDLINKKAYGKMVSNRRSIYQSFTQKFFIKVLNLFFIEVK